MREYTHVYISFSTTVRWNFWNPIYYIAIIHRRYLLTMNLAKKQLRRGNNTINGIESIGLRVMHIVDISRTIWPLSNLIHFFLFGLKIINLNSTSIDLLPLYRRMYLPICVNFWQSNSWKLPLKKPFNFVLRYWRRRRKKVDLTSNIFTNTRK